MTHYLLGSTLTLRNAKEDDLENALAKLEGAFRVYLDATEGLDTERAKKRKHALNQTKIPRLTD